MSKDHSNANSVLLALHTQNGEARIWHIILSLPGNLPNKQETPHIAKSPGDRDCAQMQKFIVRQYMETS